MLQMFAGTWAEQGLAGVMRQEKRKKTISNTYYERIKHRRNGLTARRGAPHSEHSEHSEITRSEHSEYSEDSEHSEYSEYSEDSEHSRHLR